MIHIGSHIIPISNGMFHLVPLLIPKHLSQCKAQIGPNLCGVSMRNTNYYFFEKTTFTSWLMQNS